MIRISGAHPRHRLALSVLAAALATALLAGCGGETKSGDAVPDLKASSPATATPSETATGSASKAPAPAPDGMRLITAKKSGLRFAAPDDWIIVDAAKLDDPKRQSALAEYARGVNLTMDQFRQYVAQLDVMVMAPTPTGGISANINVVPVPMAAEVPTAATIRSSFAALNAKVGEVSDADTPLGTARVATFTLPLPGGKSGHGRGVFLMAGDQVVNLTISSSDDGQAARLLDQVLPTLATTG